MLTTPTPTPSAVAGLAATLLAGAALLTGCAQPPAAGESTEAATGTHSSPRQDEKTRAATASYARYVTAQSEAFVTSTEKFVDAVKAGDEGKAKELYPVARSHFERIEPVAASFGDLDPRIDGREDITKEGRTFTGYHRLEKDLWVDGLSKDSSAIADRLLADVTTLAAKATEVEFEALDLANGSKALLDEMATGKITGEEERYSHTDLYDFAANYEGSATAVAALRPVIAEHDAELLGRIDERQQVLDRVLEQHARGDGWKLYTELSEAEVKELSTALDAYSEVVAQVAGVVAP